MKQKLIQNRMERLTLADLMKRTTQKRVVRRSRARA
jgi:hypothetical protein